MKHLPLFLLSFTCYACAPDTPDTDYQSHVWIYDPTATTDSVYPNDALTLGSSLTFTDSTAEVRDPYQTRRSETLHLRPRPADPLPDSVDNYVTVAPVDDRQILVTHYHADRPPVSRPYFIRDEQPDTVALDDLRGRAYRVELFEDLSLDLFFLDEPVVNGPNQHPKYLYSKYAPRTAGSVVISQWDNLLPVIFHFDQGPVLNYFMFDATGNIDHAERSAYRLLPGRGEDFRLTFTEVRGTQRSLRELPLRYLPPIIPDSVPLNNVVNLLNGGRFSVDDQIVFPDSANIQFRYAEDFRGVTMEELPRLDFLFSPEGDFVLFAGERQLRHRSWAISPDRRTLLVGAPGTVPTTGLPLVSYSDDELVFRMPIEVQTPVPRGEKLLSFADVDARVTVTPRR